MDIPNEIRELLKKRNELRKQGNFNGADQVRNQILDKGYFIQDTHQATKCINSSQTTEFLPSGKPGIICFFGSGEISPAGRKIHELIIRRFTPPINIALLETPTGYEDNPHIWYKRMEQRLKKGLQNYQPTISRISALRFDTELGTNNEQLLSPMKSAHYIHTGAGSPSYTVKHLQNSLAYKIIRDQLRIGVSVSLASASTIAFGKYALPVYEIYFAGHDPYWLNGLNIMAEYGLNLTFVPHWNNKEGGADIDTRFSYMGQKRFDKLLKNISGLTTIVGIDEMTALIFNLSGETVTISGMGTVTVINGKNKQVFNNKTLIPFSAFL